MSAGVPLALRSPSTLARARRATRVQFLALGVLGGTWGTHIPSVKAHYALSEATLSLVLLAAAAGAVSSLFIAGRVVGWIGANESFRSTIWYVIDAILIVE